MKLPAQGSWISSQAGDTFGDIVASRNIDLNDSGKLKLARKAMALFSYGISGSAAAGEDPGFQGTVLNVLTDDTYGYILTPTTQFVMQMDNSVAAIETPATNKPTYGFDSDSEIFNGIVHVSGGQYVSALPAGTSAPYSGRVISGLSTTVPHPLCALANKPLLAVGNGSEVKIYNTSYSNTVSIALPAQFYATSIRSRGNNIYIGTRHIYGGEARLFIANGSATTPDNGYGCGADWIYSQCEYQARMCIVTSAGQIRSFNGGGFDEVANFPVYKTPFSWASTNPNSYLVGRVANRGMTASGDFLYLCIDGSLNQGAGVYPGQFLANQPSGLWEFTTKSGLFHKAAIGFNSRLRFTVSAANSGYITTPTAHQAQTGDPVLANPVALTGLTAGQVYYAIVDSGASTTTMRLALSPADAYAGKYVSIGGTPTTDYVVVDRYETFGTDFLSYPGAVFAFGRLKPSSFFGTEVFFGAGLYDTTLTLYKAALCSLGMARNRGQFTTVRFPALGIEDLFNRLTAFVDSLNLDSDQIIVKFRTHKRFGLPSPAAFSGNGATWTSATTFTIDTNTKDVKSMAVGDEITVIKGANAGYTAHITVTDTSSSTYVVTIDESMPTTSGNFDFVADYWIKWQAWTASNLADMKSAIKKTLPGAKGNWVQFKFELRGHVILEGTELDTQPNQ